MFADQEFMVPVKAASQGGSIGTELNLHCRYYGYYGIDVKAVSGMLGHGSAGFTLAAYTHATNKVQEWRQRWGTC